jgi:predicted RNA-binding protein with PUA-like domain
MAFWLLKSEPDSFSWDQQVACGQDGEAWSGVRNHQAKNFIAQMQPGDQAFFYHTGDEKRIVGIVDITSPPFPDPTDPSWLAVTTVARTPVSKPITLGQIKATPALADMALLKQSRLSVQPVWPEEWSLICAMGGVSTP